MKSETQKIFDYYKQAYTMQMFDTLTPDGALFLIGKEDRRNFPLLAGVTHIIVKMIGTAIGITMWNVPMDPEEYVHDRTRMQADALTGLPTHTGVFRQGLNHGINGSEPMESYDFSTLDSFKYYNIGYNIGVKIRARDEAKN